MSSLAQWLPASAGVRQQGANPADAATAAAVLESSCRAFVSGCCQVLLTAGSCLHKHELIPSPPPPLRPPPAVMPEGCFTAPNHLQPRGAGKKAGKSRTPFADITHLAGADTSKLLLSASGLLCDAQGLAPPRPCRPSSGWQGGRPGAVAGTTGPLRKMR